MRITLAFLLAVAVVLCALAFAASRGQDLRDLGLLGLVTPLALIAGFVGLYLRERRRRPEADDDEDDHRHVIGMTVLKLGCLLVVTATLASLVLGIVLGR